ncbi:MAG: alginate export family protein, partial [Bacteroidota bacterium]
MKRISITMILGVLALTVFGQKTSFKKPFEEVRFEEDYYFLKDSTNLRHTLDKMKYLSLSENRNWYVSLGGEARETFEYVRLGFEDQEDDPYGFTRLGLHGTVNYKNRFKVYGELMSALQYGRTGGSRLVDENQLYVLNLFTEVRLFEKNDKSFSARIGRQELQFGSSSLFSIRDGTNVRYTFDGARLMYRSKKLDLDGFYAEYVRQDLGVFDDESFTGDKQVWGLYANYYLKEKGALILQPFYAGLNESSFYFQTGFPVVKDLRHSIGLR